jgi:hypothetical protein
MRNNKLYTQVYTYKEYKENINILMYTYDYKENINKH